MRTGPMGTRYIEIRQFGSIDSTNRYLMDEAAKGAPDGLVAVADDQTAGRGRRGRVWDSKPDTSLLFSVLFRPGRGFDVHRYGQAMGLAVLDACQLYGGFDASLKWPNDVLVGDRKLAGILTEATTIGDETHVVVGCGLNLNWHGQLPQSLENIAISADEAARKPLEASVMLDHILRALDERLRHPTWLLEAYKQRCSTIGQQVRVERMDDEVIGLAIDVDDAGALVVDLGEDGRFVANAGEVVHLRKA